MTQAIVRSTSINKIMEVEVDMTARYANTFYNDYIIRWSSYDSGTSNRFQINLDEFTKTRLEHPTAVQSRCPAFSEFKEICEKALSQKCSAIVFIPRNRL